MDQDFRTHEQFGIFYRVPESGNKMSEWRNRPRNFTSVTVYCVLLFLFLFKLPITYAEPIKPSRLSQEIIRQGERIYRDGILPSGEPVMAFVKGDLPVSGAAFSCVSCHLRGGLGSVEGGVFTPPTNGASLFKAFRVLFKGLDQKYFPFPDRRPAYDDKSLAEAIRSGENPAGSLLNDVMPRYLLEDEEMAILITYLKSLSAQFSPGVSDTTLRFATVITDDVSPGDRDAMLAPLEQYINIKNNQAKSYKDGGKRSRQMAENMMVSKELATRNLTLSRWVLKGAPETWRRQLDDYYRKEPVFALLGGITGGEWQPIHQFSEENRIPCLLPQTDFPVISDTDWYTLYFSKGYYQEGEAAARYLNSREDVQPDSQVVQIFRDSSEGRALSAGFDQTWRDLGRQTPTTLKLNSNEKLTGEFLKTVVAKYKPVAVLLWDGPLVSTPLEILAEAGNAPAIVFVSSRYLGNQFRTLPEKVRDFTYITYPFVFAQKTKQSSMGSIFVEDESKWSVSLDKFNVPDDKSGASNLSYSVTQLLTMALMDMLGNYYRDNFLDVIGMVADQPSMVFGRLSFGPGQRYASKGCYIVQLTKGPNPEITRKSRWVIH
jgi:hypothetical protein